MGGAGGWKEAGGGGGGGGGGRWLEERSLRRRKEEASNVDAGAISWRLIYDAPSGASSIGATHPRSGGRGFVS